jgi:hypothetical protein
LRRPDKDISSLNVRFEKRMTSARHGPLGYRFWRNTHKSVR